MKFFVYCFYLLQKQDQTKIRCHEEPASNKVLLLKSTIFNSESIRMKRFCEVFSVVILSEIASSSGISTNVVSHAFCESNLSEDDKMDKKTLDEVHTFAELKHDPRASLPDSFTICSAIMTTNCQTFDWPIYFNLLDDNRTQLVVPNRSYGSMENHFFINQL